MAIIVEDGSIVANANSYASEAALTAYAAARGVTLTGDEDDLLIQAMDYVESLDFIGFKLTYDQPLQWPRADVVIDGYYVGTDVIPQLLIDGLCEVAIAIDTGESPYATITQSQKRVKVDVLEVEYMDGTSTAPINRKISLKLGKLTNSGATDGYGFDVIKG